MHLGASSLSLSFLSSRRKLLLFLAYRPSSLLPDVLLTDGTLRRLAAACKRQQGVWAGRDYVGKSFLPRWHPVSSLFGQKSHYHQTTRCHRPKQRSFALTSLQNCDGVDRMIDKLVPVLDFLLGLDFQELTRRRQLSITFQTQLVARYGS